MKSLKYIYSNKNLRFNIYGNTSALILTIAQDYLYNYRKSK